MKFNFNDLSCKELYLIFLDVLKNHNVRTLFQGKNWFSNYGNSIIVFNNDTGDSVKFYTEFLDEIDNVQSHLSDDEEDYNYDSSYSDIDEIIRLTVGNYVKEFIQSYRKLFISHSENILIDI